MEVYVDDMLVKSPTVEQNIKDLANTFRVPLTVQHEVKSWKMHF